jgi:hypothetical protein
MKNTLGKLLIFIYLGCVALASSLATYKLTASKENPKIKEAVEIKFVAHQKDHEDVMFFFLEPKKSQNYKIVLLKKESKELAYHDKKTTFTFLVFALKSGDIKVEFDFTIKVASDEAVAQVYRGSRDNVKWIETQNTKIKLNPLILKVQNLKSHVALIGDFKLSSTIKDTNISAYKSTNITYHLEGVGYDEIEINPIQSIKDVKIFSQITKHYNKATKDGYEIQREFNYALIAEKSFQIKPKEIKCYSPKTDTYYTLKTKPYNINVSKLDTSTLIDNDDFPKQKDYFEPLKKFFIYIVIFLAGFLSARFIPTKKGKKKEKFLDIKDAQNAKELLYILMHSYPQHNLKDFSKKLEEIVYAKADKSEFIKIKKEILIKLK